MAVQNYTLTKPYTNIVSVIWQSLGNADTGLPVDISKYTDVTVHVFGTFGGATFTMEGSNDDRANPSHASHASAEWFTLTDGQGNAISKTTASGEVVQESVFWLRPKTAGGTGTSLTLALKGKKAP